MTRLETHSDEDRAGQRSTDQSVSLPGGRRSSRGSAVRSSAEVSRQADSRELPFEYVNPTSTGRLLKKESAHDHPHVDALRDKASEEKVVRGHVMSAADIFKFAGLIVFFVVIGVVCYLIWPLISDIFEEGGIERVMDRVQNAGPLGVVFLLIIEFLQVVVAFIPGEVVQVAAGMLYGPWLGALVIVAGCVISSAFVFVLVHKLGAPFVQGMVSEKYLGKFRKFEASGKLNTVVFVLFLIPGLPKDVFTYLVPLTDMRMRTFLLISNTARIPGVVVSTYAAAGIVQGDYVQSTIIFAVTAAIAVLGVVSYGRIMKFLEERAGVPFDPSVKEKLDPEDYRTRTEILEIVSEEVEAAAGATRISSASAGVSHAGRANGAARAASASAGAGVSDAAAQRPSRNPREALGAAGDSAHSQQARSNDPRARARARANARSHSHNPRTHNSRAHGK